MGNNVGVIEPIARGIELAVERVTHDLEGFRPSQEDLDLAESLVKQVLESGIERWHPRAVLLLSDLIAIGVCSRSYYGEPRLDAQTAIRFAHSLEELENCWMHE
jgi:hypothetical protein